MALADVLSAMREIILDAPILPADEAARQHFYRSAFPRLSGAEIEDLAKVPERQWRTYTSSIFAGERNILRRYFEVTFALLERAWPRISPEPFNAFELVRAMHRVRPWKDRAVSALADCFAGYLASDRPDIAAACPAALDMARLEIQAVYLRHAADDEFAPRDSLTPPDLNERTVAAVLELDMYIPSLVKVERFSCDAPALRREYYRSGEKLPDVIPAAASVAVAGRNANGFTRWTSVEPAVGAFFDTVPRTTRTPLGGLAEAFVAALPAELSDTEMFTRFLDRCGELIAGGALILLEPAAPEGTPALRPA